LDVFRDIYRFSSWIFPDASVTGGMTFAEVLPPIIDADLSNGM
jgi:hypothetical protein